MVSASTAAVRHSANGGLALNGLSFSQYLSQNRSDIVFHTQQHALLSFYCIVLATVLGLLISIAVYRSNVRTNFTISTAAVVFTLPSVALFGFLVSVVGYGLAAVFPVVVAYAMLPIIRNGIVGLQSADPAVLDAARGMGVGSFRMLWQIRLPIAWPVILAGVRVSAQLTVGVVAIAAFVTPVGLGNYGYDALDNLGSVNTKDEAIVCIVFVALVALVFDAVFVVIRRFTTPRGSRA
jgi:osmoprotectant transport system permease protein